MERIEIVHFDLEFERNIQTTESYVELHYTYLRYVSKYDCEVPKDRDDLAQGWIEKFRDFELCLKRENFVTVEKYWDDLQDYWEVQMEINGFPKTLVLYFEKANTKRMEEVFLKLFNWVFPYAKNNTMIEIEKIAVVSSNIEGIGFKEDETAAEDISLGTLRVWFKNGSAYDYDKVPKSEFEALKNAQSVGSHFAANIKGKYEYKKV